jgi:hypothetical protein
MRNVSSLISHEMMSSPKRSSTTSTMTSSGRSATIRSSSSMTPMRKKRCARRMPPTPKSCLLLLQGPRPQPPPPPPPMKLSRGCKAIIVMILPPIKRRAMVTAVEKRLARLRLPCQSGACREACFKENFKGSALLLHILFCAEKWGW